MNAPASGTRRLTTTDMLPRLAAFVKTIAAAWQADKVPRLAAALAYTAIFAIAPLIIIIVAVAGEVLGFTHGAHPHTAVENALLDNVRRAAGPEAASVVRDMVSTSFAKPHQNVFAQIAGWVTFLIAATGLFATLQDALNTVWDVEPQQRSLWAAVRDRAAALVMLPLAGLVLLATLAANAAIALFAAPLNAALHIPADGVLIGVATTVVSFGLLTVLFAAIYKVLPETTIRWNDVWAGAALTAALFLIGQALIGWYIARAGVASAYGASGSLLALLVWMYYSALVVLSGAEFTKVYASSRGEGIAAVATHEDRSEPATSP